VRWFKHRSDAADDESLAAMIDKFGVAAYGIYWIILEKIAAQMDASGCTSVQYPVKKWQNFTGTSPALLRKVTGFLSEPKNFRSGNAVFSLKNEGNLLEISCPKLLKYRDEYTRKTSTGVRSVSGETPDNVALEAEAEADTEKELAGNSTISSQNNGMGETDSDLPPPLPPVPAGLVEEVARMISKSYKKTITDQVVWGHLEDVHPIRAKLALEQFIQKAERPSFKVLKIFIDQIDESEVSRIRFEQIRGTMPDNIISGTTAGGKVDRRQFLIERGIPPEKILDAPAWGKGKLKLDLSEEELNGYGLSFTGLR